MGEQLYDVLSALRRGPLILTHLMYKSNLNANVLKELMRYLSSEGLIEALPDTRIHLTAKGCNELKLITPFFAFVAKSRELRHKLRETPAID
jgi:predicted transcriptional regulator